MVQIRSAREDEAGLLAEIGFRAWESASDGWGDDMEVRESAEMSFRNFTSSNWLTIDIAEKAGQVVGWSARENLDNNITDLWVEPVFQRQGIGGLMLAAICDEVKKLGHETVTAEVHSENASAVAFFLKHGFRVSWMTTRWSAKLDSDVDTIGMVKELDEPQASSGAEI